MHSQFVIAALAATASASANLFPAHKAIQRDLLMARQTESTEAPSATSGDLSDTECQVSLLAIATSLPIPDADLLDWEQSQGDANPCSVTSVPSSLSSQYTSYTEAVLSWIDASSSALYEAISACPQYASAAVSEVQACATGSASEAAATASQSDNSEASSTGSSAGTATESGSSDSTGTATESGSTSSTGTASGSASSSVETTAGAPLREAGMMGAVLAGVLGVAVAL